MAGLSLTRLHVLFWILLAALVSNPLQQLSAILLDLEEIAETDASGVTLYIGIYHAANIVSCMIAVPVNRRLGDTFSVPVAIVLKGLPLILVCFMPLPGMIAVSCVYSIGLSVLNLASCNLCNKLGKEKYSFLFNQLYFLGNSFSYFVEPAIEKPFLSSNRAHNSNSFQSNRNESIPVNNTGNHHPSKLYMPLTAVGGMSILIALAWILLAKYLKWHSMVDDSTTNYQNIGHGSKRNMYYRTLTTISFFVTSFFCHGIQSVQINLMVYICVNSTFNIDQQVAVSMALAFYLSMLIYRIIGILLTFLMTPLSTAVTSNALMLTSITLSAMFHNYCPEVLWFFSISTGFFNGLTAVPLFSYAAAKFSGDRSIISAIQLGYCAASLVLPTGYMIMYTSTDIGKTGIFYLFFNGTLSALALLFLWVTVLITMYTLRFDIVKTNKSKEKEALRNTDCN